MKLSKPKYIFVTGGVASSLGKGVISASVAQLLQARGYSVTVQKFDPYINADPVSSIIFLYISPSMTIFSLANTSLLFCLAYLMIFSK